MGALQTRRAGYYKEAPDKPGVDRGAQFFVMSLDGSLGRLPTAYIALFGNARDKTIVNVCGGCRGFTEAEKAALLASFPTYLMRPGGNHYGGVIMSGGTEARTGEFGARDNAITQLPGLVVSTPGFERAVALAHVPKVDVMSLAPESGRVVMDNHWTGLDLAHDAILVVQPNESTSGDWDLDVPLYRQCMLNARQMAGFKLGNMVMNGGLITLWEIYDGLLEGIPTIILRGTGREADAAAAVFERGDYSLTAQELRAKRGDAFVDGVIAKVQAKVAQIDTDLVHVADYRSLAQVQAGLIKYGLL